MDNEYKHFFDEIKKIILILEIEKEDVVCGCSEDEIKKVENKFGKLPIAYRAYLESFGRNFLFSFFDGAQFSYDDYDDINEFVNRTLESDNFEITRPYIPIGHRRYDYFYYFYLDEPDEDNPILWSYTPYPDGDEENPATTQRRFTDLILSYFRGTLRDFPAGFHFVDINETDKNIVRRRYENWARKIVSTVDHINFYHAESTLVKKVYDIFLSYFNSEKATILKLAKSFTEPELKTNHSPTDTTIKQRSENQNIKEEENTVESSVSKDKTSIWNKLLRWLR